MIVLLQIVAALAVFAASGSQAPAVDVGVSQPIAPFSLGLPARCTLGETCWIVNYVDVDPGSAAQDFRCEARTYDGHDGIDLAVRDRAVMDAGVPVVAAASGIVHRIRDGVADVGLTDALSREAVAGRECGNGVVLDHGDGWETQYCHLKRHSLLVKTGQKVEPGAPLGLIGLSGKTEFPHVHLTLRHRGMVLDPFTGLPKDTGCGQPGRSLWRDSHITYEGVALYHAGFSGAEPQAEAIRQGRSGSGPIAPDAPALVLWVDIFGVKAGDQLRFHITAPDGRIVLDRPQSIEHTQARRFAFAGIRRRDSFWPSGAYAGVVSLQRGQETVTVTRTGTVAAVAP